MKAKEFILIGGLIVMIAALIFQYRRLDRIHTENRALREQLSAMTESARTRTAVPTAGPEAASSLSPEEFAELLRLRGELSRLRHELEERTRAASSAGQKTEAPVFHWSSRPELSQEQSRLAMLRHKFERMSEVDPRWPGVQEEIARLVARLGPEKDLRPARPDELVLSRPNGSEVSEVFNPTHETLVVHIGVKGDREWIGSMEASMMREVYLPPGGRLLVPNLETTSPRMARAD
jgi:hypothetical protein